jgi:metal-responsive CopG/Arc/MetJ family transcriptional regulator
MRTVISVSFSEEMADELEKIARAKGRTKSSLIKEALRAYLWEEKFKEVKRKIVPKAKSKGLVTDDDVFRAVS